MDSSRQTDYYRYQTKTIIFIGTYFGFCLKNYDNLSQLKKKIRSMAIMFSEVAIVCCIYWIKLNWTKYGYISNKITQFCHTTTRTLEKTIISIKINQVLFIFLGGISAFDSKRQIKQNQFWKLKKNKIILNIFSGVKFHVSRQFRYQIV